MRGLFRRALMFISAFSILVCFFGTPHAKSRRRPAMIQLRLVLF
jgi:hypothetical protein